VSRAITPQEASRVDGKRGEAARLGQPALVRTITAPEAAARLGHSLRHVRRLVRNGVLKTEGTGNRRRITMESVRRFAERKKWDISSDMSLLAGGNFGHDQIVQRMIRALPPLSEPRAAAKKLGVPPGEFEQLITEGSIPVIRIGARAFVPRVWLGRLLASADGIADPHRLGARLA
jgi:excisionase family DNA binding protein